MSGSIGQAIRQTREALGWSQERLAREVATRAGTVGQPTRNDVYRWESGRRKPTAWVEHLSAALGIDLLAMAAPSEHESRINHVTDHPTRLDSGAVEALEAALAAQRRTDDLLGPDPLIDAAEAHREAMLRLLAEARGSHRNSLAAVVAEHVLFTGWLRAEQRDERRASVLLNEACDMADDIGDGHLAAQAIAFRGYLGRVTGKPHLTARWFSAAAATRGAHIAQRAEALSQAAQGFAELGDKTTARRMLGEATDLVERMDTAGPLPVAYWLENQGFQLLGIGLAYAALGDTQHAREYLTDGLASLPADQQGSVWATEYRAVLERL